MDRSMDSIGSCSLDVDAESSDISDTSGSLNFPTPISIKDITREFTANIRERCSVQTVKNNTTAYVDPITGQVCIALTNNTTTTTTKQPTATVNNNINTVLETHNSKTTVTTTNNHHQQHHHQQQHISSPQTPIAAAVDTYEKKPSYLNLACCVNGYSNITTYDSKIRQDINKSREVSPIRPSTTSLQYCKKSNSLAPPVLLAMPNVNVTSPHHHHHHHHLPHMATNGGGGGGAIMTTIGTKYTIIENNNHSQNGGPDSSLHNLSVGDDIGGGGVGVNGGNTVTRSFIQQRVERLYGPGALAQGFYSPKKIRESPQRLNRSLNSENGGGGATSELVRKFQELSPSKDYNKFREKLSSNGKPSLPPANASSSAAENLNSENNNIDLPCLRHLSQEFRAQLPIVSPKRNFSRTSPGRDLTTTTASANNKNVSQNSNNSSSSTIITTTTTMTVNKTQNYSTSNGITTSNSDITNNTNTTTNNHQSHPDLVYKSQNLNSSSSSSTAAGPMGSDEVDRKVQLDANPIELLKTPPKSTPSPLSSSLAKSSEELLVITPNAHISNNETAAAAADKPTTSNGSAARDGHFFLRQLKAEQNRLLELAAVAEKYMDALASNPDITEDTMGLLRSASGKARLLVSQKMKQFEGLCHNNLNSSPEDQFPTTVDDLQGFWDMVYLQVDHIDLIFKEIEILKANDWKKPANLPPTTSSSNNVLKTPKPNKTLKSRTNTPMANGSNSVSSTPSAAALKREAQRKKLQEMKRRNREAMAAAATASPAPSGDATVEVGIVDGIEILEANSNNKQQPELQQDS
ncbi:uncharacterized membrane protein DDB_G0293934 isoform X2 [Musca domestica]|uniref:Guanylate-kinase-associated protein (GKAP) protein n=1 Tax=Musca domestica TaxID=7370 RepID=T1P8P8_MUSDO|nr:uncharacterized membrane protein DDB_G0293934 isoform X2 [Musca domestica]XP_058986755.1 uncharacterized membrane protein DDB_G0293934 isoform X2 [Musca domestica]